MGESMVRCGVIGDPMTFFHVLTLGSFEAFVQFPDQTIVVMACENL